MRRDTTSRHLVVLAILAVITLVMTYPLVFELGSSVRDPGDPLLNAWILAWDLQQYRSGNVAGFFDANIFYPHQRTLAFSEHLLPQSLVGAVPLLISDNPVFVHNLLVLLSMLTSAFGMYLLAVYMTGDAPAAFLAAIIYAFSPFMFDHLSHMQLLTAGGIPLAFLFLARLFDTERWSDLAWLWFFLVLQMLAAGYYAVYLTFFVSVTIAYHVLSSGRYRDPRFLGKLTVLAMGVAVATGPFMYQYIALQRELGLQRGIGSQAVIESFASVPSINRLYGGVLPNHDEAQLFPGFTAYLLALVGLGAAVSASRGSTASATPDLSLSSRRNWLLFFIAILVFSVAASFGPVGVSPYRLLLRWVPGFDGLRAVARIHIMTLTSLAVLAALGAARIRTGVRSLWVRRVVVVGFPLLLLVEYFSAPIPTFRTPPRDQLPQVYGWLAEDPGGGPILELPLTYRGPRKYRREIARVYASTIHWRQMFNGYSGYLPPVYLEMRKRWDHLGPQQVLADARRLGVEQVLVHTAFFWRSGLRATHTALASMEPPALKIADIDGVEVWKIADPDAVAEWSGNRAARDLSSTGWEATATVAPELAGLAIDGDPDSRWRGTAREPGQVFTIDLPSPRRFRAIRLSHGRYQRGFPRGLKVEVSDGVGGWQVVVDRRFDRLPIEAYLEPIAFPLVVEFEPVVARSLRLTNTAPHDTEDWVINELTIW
jgi:hypothetical protein